MNGRLVNAEGGERFNFDEFGNIHITNRGSSRRYKSYLDRIAGSSFSGKGRALSQINANTFPMHHMQKGGSIARAEFGKTIPIQTQFLTGGQNVNVTSRAELSNEQVEYLANKMGAAIEAGAYGGTVNGSGERERINERLVKAQTRATI
jgi:hypothetical protein